ncbi:MAG: TolC family protein [Paramuribaculum sp.]|nr:TolC family protein [Paramuribaculum sp.]
MKQHLFISILLFGAVGSFAQNWSYADCVNWAREHNISLRKSQLSEQTALHNLEESKGAWQPTIDFATTHGVTNYPWATGNKNTYNSTYGFNAGWTVWNGGERENTIKQNKLRAEISQLNTVSVLRSLETDLLQVYLNILYAKETIGIYEQAVQLSEAQSNRACQLMEAGKMSRVDYSQLKSQYDQDCYELVNAQGTYSTRCMELKQLLELGIDTVVEVKPAQWTQQQVMAQLPPIKESYDMALSTDLYLQSLEKEQSVANLDVAIAKAGRMPKISLNAGVGTGFYAPGGSWGKTMKQGINESIGLTLSVPILDGKKTKTAVARANVSKLEAQLDYDRRQTELAQIVENWYIDTQSAQSRYSAALSQLESAKLSDELTNEQFALGYINTVELMTAHNAYIEAQHSVLQAKYMAMLGQKMIEFYRNAHVELP